MSNKALTTSHASARHGPPEILKRIRSGTPAPRRCLPRVSRRSAAFIAGVIAGVTLGSGIDTSGRGEVERAMRIELTAQAWEAWVLPLYDARSWAFSLHSNPNSAIEILTARGRGFIGVMDLEIDGEGEQRAAAQAHARRWSCRMYNCTNFERDYPGASMCAAPLASLGAP